MTMPDAPAPERTGTQWTSRELVSRALQGLPLPRPVVGPLAVHFCARWAGVSLADYTLKPQVLADCVVRYYEAFQPDVVWLSADTWVTAQAMGAPVAFPSADQPLDGTGQPAIRTAADVDRIPPPDPGSQGRWPIMLEAMQRLRRALGKEVFLVACFDQYPFSLACALMGLDKAMSAVIEDRPWLDAVMARGVEYAVAYALALAEAGADMLSGGDSPAGLIGPTAYRQIALPYEQRVIAALKAKVAVPVSLHICGNTTAFLADMARSGADVLELDHQVDLAAASPIVGSERVLWGNLDPVGLLRQGTPDQVWRRTGALVEALTAVGHRRFVVSSGCTLALDTPADNLRAMFDAARRFAWPV